MKIPDLAPVEIDVELDSIVEPVRLGTKLEIGRVLRPDEQRDGFPVCRGIDRARFLALRDREVSQDMFVEFVRRVEEPTNGIIRLRSADISEATKRALASGTPSVPVPL